MEIDSILREIGLTGNEIKVYSALLDLGESTTGQILVKAELRTGKIYEILESLKKKGFVSEIKKNNVRVFAPVDPNRVLDYLEERKENLEQQKTEYSNILPDLLKKISFVKKKTNIEIFTGIKGMKTAFAKQLQVPKNNTLYIYGVTSVETYRKSKETSIASDYFVNYQKPRREKYGYKAIKKILNESARNDQFAHEKNAEIRYLPYGSMVSLNIVADISIIGIYTGEFIFIVIESEEVANNFIEQFELLWRIAKR